MGSDLIGVHIVGPRKLEFYKPRKKILGVLDKRITQVNDWFTDRKKPWPIPWIHDVEHLSIIRYLSPKEVVDNFIKLYTEKESYRDVVIRYFRVAGISSRSVFAGDTSFGDEPQGDGYRIIRDADDLGVLSLTNLYK